MTFPHTSSQAPMNVNPPTLELGYVPTTRYMPMLTPSEFLDHPILPPSIQVAHGSATLSRKSSGLVFPLPTQVGNTMEVTQIVSPIPTTIQIGNSSMSLTTGARITTGGNPPLWINI